MKATQHGANAGGPHTLSTHLDDMASEKKLNLKKEDSVRLNLHAIHEGGYGGAFSTKPTYSVDGGNSVADNSPRLKKLNQSPESKKDAVDTVKVEDSIKKGDHTPKELTQNEALLAQQNPSSPTKRDGDIEDF